MLISKIKFKKNIYFLIHLKIKNTSKYNLYYTFNLFKQVIINALNFPRNNLLQK